MVSFKYQVAVYNEINLAEFEYKLQFFLVPGYMLFEFMNNSNCEHTFT